MAATTPGLLRFVMCDERNDVISEASIRPITDEERAALLPNYVGGAYSLEEVYTRPASRSKGHSSQMVGNAITWAARWAVPLVCRARAHGRRAGRLDQLQLEAFYWGLGFRSIEQTYYTEVWMILWPGQS